MTLMTLQAVRQLIADDSYAITFQSFGQYRGALLRHLDSLTAAPTVPEQVAQGADEKLEDLRRKFIGSITAATSLGEKAVWDLAVMLRDDAVAALSQPSEAAPLEPIGQVVMYLNYSTVIRWKEGVTPPAGTLLYADAPSLPAAALSDEAKLRQFIVNWSAALYPNPDELMAAIKANIEPAPAAGDELPVGVCLNAQHCDFYRAAPRTALPEGCAASDMYPAAVVYTDDQVIAYGLAEADAALAHQPAQGQAEPVAWVCNDSECGWGWTGPASPAPHCSFCAREMDRAAPSQAAQHEAGDERFAKELDERAKYEAFLTRIAPNHSCEVDIRGQYVNYLVQIGWQVWQASAALAASPVVRAQSEESEKTGGAA